MLIVFFVISDYFGEGNMKELQVNEIKEVVGGKCYCVCTGFPRVAGTVGSPQACRSMCEEMGEKMRSCT